MTVQPVKATAGVPAVTVAVITNADPLVVVVGVTTSEVVVGVCASATTHGITVMRAIKVRTIFEKVRELDLRLPKQLLKVTQQNDIHISITSNSPIGEPSGERGSHVEEFLGTVCRPISCIVFTCYFPEAKLGWCCYALIEPSFRAPP